MGRRLEPALDLLRSASFSEGLIDKLDNRLLGDVRHELGSFQAIPPSVLLGVQRDITERRGIGVSDAMEISIGPRALWVAVRVEPDNRCVLRGRHMQSA